MTVDYLTKATNSAGEDYSFLSAGSAFQEWESPLTRRSATIAVLADGGVDPTGNDPFFADPRTLLLKFTQVLGSQPYSRAMTQCKRFFAVGRRVKLYKTDSDGNSWYNTGKTLSFPEKATYDDGYRIEFEITFELENVRWRSEFPPGWQRYDDGHWNYDDASFTYDLNPDSYALASNAVAHTINQVDPISGNPVSAPDYPIFTISGPYSGTIYCYNASIANPRWPGMGFLYTRSLAIGDVLVIDTAARSVLLNGTPDRYNFRAFDQQRGYFRLDPGANIVTITSDGALGSTYSGHVMIERRLANF